MSCESNLSQASASAALCGISKIQSKAAAVSTVMANRVLNTIDRGGQVDRFNRSPAVNVIRNVGYIGAQAAKIACLSAAGVAITAAASPLPLIPELAVAAGVSLGTTGTSIGIDLYNSQLRADKSRGPVEKIALMGRTLEIALDEADRDDPEAGMVLIWPKKGDPNSVVFEAGGDNWEKSVRYQGGQKITCLKTPYLFQENPEIYFKGELSNEDAIKIALDEIRPKDYHRLPGYLGQIDKIEKLSPAWSLVKRAMIYQSAGGEQGTPAHKLLNAATIGPRTTLTIFDAARSTARKALVFRRPPLTPAMGQTVPVR